MASIIKNIITDIIGMNTRFLFYKLIGKPKTKEFLRGETNKSTNQYIVNNFIGLATLGVILLVIAKLFGTIVFFSSLLILLLCLRK